MITTGRALPSGWAAVFQGPADHSEVLMNASVLSFPDYRYANSRLEAESCLHSEMGCHRILPFVLVWGRTLVRVGLAAAAGFAVYRMRLSQS